MKLASLAILAALTLVGVAARADDTVTTDTAPKAEAPAKAAKKKKAKKAATADESKDAKADTKKEATPKTVTKEDGLVIEDLKVGTGMEAHEGSRVRVHYTGTFMNGKTFDSNAKDANPEPFTLDKNHLIAGWVEGIPGMKVGGKRHLKVPFKLAYGENGTPDGTIPPRADLNFEVELLKVE